MHAVMHGREHLDHLHTRVMEEDWPWPLHGGNANPQEGSMPGEAYLKVWHDLNSILKKPLGTVQKSAPSQMDISPRTLTMAPSRDSRGLDTDWCCWPKSVGFQIGLTCHVRVDSMVAVGSSDACICR